MQYIAISSKFENVDIIYICFMNDSFPKQFFTSRNVQFPYFTNSTHFWHSSLLYAHFWEALFPRKERGENYVKPILNH